MERRIFEKKNTILVTKMTISSHGGISKKIFIVYALMVNGTLSQKFHPNSTLTG